MASPRRRTVSAVVALAFVAVLVVTLVVALVTRPWDGLEAVVIPALVVAVAVLGAWVLLLSVALVRGRSWARQATMATFLLASVVAGVALLDTVQRALVDRTAPLVHLVLPGLLFALAASVVRLVAGDRGRPPPLTD
jgi:DMSO reductase anchor subunit